MFYNYLLSLNPVDNFIIIYMIFFLFLYFNLYVLGIIKKLMASITQLVRVLGCGSKSHRFESCYSPLFF